MKSLQSVTFSHPAVAPAGEITLVDVSSSAIIATTTAAGGDFPSVLRLLVGTGAVVSPIEPEVSGIVYDATRYPSGVTLYVDGTHSPAFTFDAAQAVGDIAVVDTKQFSLPAFLAGAVAATLLA